jgi:hypothetical protein
VSSISFPNISTTALTSPATFTHAHTYRTCKNTNTNIISRYSYP